MWETIAEVVSLTRLFCEKGMEVIPEIVRMPELAERRAEPSRNFRAQVRFRAGGTDVHAAVDEAIDQRADDFRPVEHFAASAPDVGREAIEVQDLSVEKDDRNF
jgi:hypothetical protein